MHSVQIREMTESVSRGFQTDRYWNVKEKKRERKKKEEKKEKQKGEREKKKERRKKQVHTNTQNKRTLYCCVFCCTSQLRTLRTSQLRSTEYPREIKQQYQIKVNQKKDNK
jgi:hypothetical protein